VSGIRVRRGYRNPFSQVPEDLLDWSVSGVSDRATRLWGLLDRYAGADGQAFPSRRKLAGRLGCSLDTLDRAVRELEAAGWLHVERRADVGATSLDTLLNLLEARAEGGRTAAAPPLGMDAAPRGRTAAAGGSRTGAAQKDSQGNESPPLPPDGGSEWLPVKVDRKAVTPAERELCDAILAEFNRQAGTRFSGAPDHRRAIVGRIREHRAIELRHHSRIIAVALADPWWSGPPGPQVIYGKAGVFEQAIERARAARGSSLSADEVARLRDERHARLMAEAEAAERAASSPEGAAARAAIRERFRLDERTPRAS
jgi:hypothetical protein